MGMFYVDDGLIGYRDLEWLQGFLNVLIRLFHRVGLMANITKSNTTTFQLVDICTWVSEEVFSWSITGYVATYWERLQRCIPCPYCGVELKCFSMTVNCILFHGPDPVIDWDQLSVSQMEHLPTIYDVRFLTIIQ